jgi:glycolate oxidase FAD binding subunit
MASLSQDLSQEFRQAVLDAASSGQPLALQGGGSKTFYGREIRGKVLDLSGHRGIVSYEPTELVITARGGTPLSELESAMSKKGQILPFEPPHFSSTSTIGGAIASGLSGPRRPWGGAPRDLLLGVKLLDGRGRILTFGGQVMKNVAGYDLSRLMAGAMGTLGILLEVSIKVLPAPKFEPSLQFEANEAANRRLTEKMLEKGLPISATYAHHGVMRVRFSCSRERLKEIQNRYGGELYESNPLFWQQLRDHRREFFDSDQPLWRLSLPQAAKLKLDRDTLHEWAGALRWLKSDLPALQIRQSVTAVGGHASCFRYGDRSGDIFHPLQERLGQIQQQLKTVFDPRGVFNPGRLYPDL